MRLPRRKKFKEQKNVLVPLRKAAPFDVGVGQLIDQCDLWHAGEDGVDIHLGKECALVLNLSAWDLFQFCGELSRAAAAVRLNNASDDVLTAASAANAFAQHAEGFADTRGISQEDFEAAALLFCIAAQQPVFRGFAFVYFEVIYHGRTILP